MSVTRFYAWKIASIAAAAFALAACAPRLEAPLAQSQKSQAVTVLVYREPSVNIGLASLYFGERAGERVSYFLKLENAEYAEIQLAPGSYEFIVASGKSLDFPLPVELKPGKRTCIRTYANPANYAKILVPLLMRLTQVFTMEMVACPGADFLRNYTRASPPR